MTESSRRILVLDDDKLLREMARDLLRALGYESDLASEGGEAVTLYRQAMESGSPYCAVLVDLKIQDGMGGLEAARKIRDMDGKAGLIVCSGFCEGSVVEHYEEYGFKASMPKPYGLMDLKAVLDRICPANR